MKNHGQNLLRIDTQPFGLQPRKGWSNRSCTRSWWNNHIKRRHKQLLAKCSNHHSNFGHHYRAGFCHFWHFCQQIGRAQSHFPFLLSCQEWLAKFAQSKKAWLQSIPSRPPWSSTKVGGLSWPRSSGNGSSRGEIPLNSISLQTSGIPTFKFLLFKSTHLFSNLAIIFFLLKPFLMTCVFFLKNSPLKPLLLSITLLLATMLLLPVCAKILSKYLAALPLKRHQNLLLYSNWCQFSASPHFNIQSSNPILLVQD